MVTGARQHYRGVLCTYCREPIPLSPSAEQKVREFDEHGPSGLDQFALRSVTLRCRACHCEGLYTHSDVIDCDGSPRKRSRGRASP